MENQICVTLMSAEIVKLILRISPFVKQLMLKNEIKTNIYSQKEWKKIVLKMSFSNMNSDYYFMYKTYPVTTVYMTLWTIFLILQICK